MSGKRDYEVEGRWGRLSLSRGLDLDSPRIDETATALDLLSECTQDVFSMQSLRDLLHDEYGPDRWQMSDDELVRFLAERVAAGEICISRPAWPPEPAFPGEAPRHAAAAVKRPAATPLHWIKIRVVDDVTTAPVSGIEIVLSKPDAVVARQHSDAEGMIELRGIPAGTCEVSCDLTDARLSKTWAFVTTGDEAAADTAAAGEEVDSEPLTGGVIASVHGHAVQRGETLKRLASTASMAWQELAEFNWGSSHPDVVERHLEEEIGAARVDREGGYVIDEPHADGVIWIPRPWKLTKLPTDLRHTIRVRRVRPKRTVLLGTIWVKLVSVFDAPVCRVECRLHGGGREWPTQQSSMVGEVLWQDVPLDTYQLELVLDRRSVQLDVPWLRDKEQVHWERVPHLEELLGPSSCVHGIQVRLLGLAAALLRAVR